MILSKFKPGLLIAHRYGPEKYVAEIIYRKERPFQIRAKVLHNSGPGGARVGAFFTVAPDMWLPLASFKDKLKELI